MGLEDVCQGILFFLVVVVVGVRCGAVLWWGTCSRLGSVYCMNGLMEWEGIYMLLTAGYSISLFLPCHLFDYSLQNILGTRLDEFFYTLTSSSWQSCDSFSVVVVWTSYNQRMRCPGLGFTPLFPSFSLDRLISHIGAE